MRSLYPHEGKKEMPIDFTIGKYPRMFFFPMRAWNKGEEKPVPPYSAIVYKEGDEVRAEDQKGRKIASGNAGVDDVNVIQNAIDKLTSGGRIFIKRGTYTIPSIPDGGNAITVKPNIEVIGEGETTVLRLADGISVSNPSAAIILQENAVLRNLVLDGNKDNVAGKINGVDMTGDGSKTIKVHVKRWSWYGVRPLHIENALVHECIGESCGWSNFMPTGAKRSVISNCISFNGGHNGISCDASEYCTIIGNVCYGNGYAGVRLGVGSNRCVVVGNACYDNVGCGVRCYDGANRNIISSNICIQCGFVGITVENADYNIVSSNLVMRGQHGIRLYAASHNIIKGNLCMENYQSGDPSGANILLTQDCHYNLITANTCRIGNGERSTAWGVYIKSTTPANTDNRIINNDLYNSGATQIIYDGGENTIIRDNAGWITENSGTQTFDGDGTTIDFLIGAHGLAITDPSKIVVKVTPVSQDAIDASPCIGYVDTSDNSKIRVKFDSAPASGSGNVKITWEAIVI